MTWMAFFLCFFGWFAVAPLMPLVRQDLGLTKEQIGNTMIASVAITVLVRLIIGWLCDRIGPRRVYSILMVFGSLPIMGIGLAHHYGSFLLFRLAIGAIGASFVITQYHTSVMFNSNCVGTANATTAGWGNLGGGITQMVMPLILSVFLSFGLSSSLSWRLSMIVPGAALLVMGVLYYFFTQDFPEGNLNILQEQGKILPKKQVNGAFKAALTDYRVWALFVMYAASFGVELTINNIAALYFTDQFALPMTQAGLVAGLFGAMNLFARALGGIFSDHFARRVGLKGRVLYLGSMLLMGGLALMLFSCAKILFWAIASMILFALFIKMANGATYAVVPFINKKALGAVAGIIGAGGNAGGVLFGFLFRAETLTYSTALLFLGMLVVCSSLCCFLVRFSLEDEKESETEIESAWAREINWQAV